MRRTAVFLLIACSAGHLTMQANPILRVVRDEHATMLLQNGAFEQAQDGKAVGWQPAPKGYRLAAGEGRLGSQALACENESGNGWYGASQSIVLNQTNATPLTVRGWSKAAGVSGGTDNDYSLYVDLTYADGSSLWGQTANFRTGTHDWQQRQFMIFPDKPVKALSFHCLFRGHAGKVWFDDIGLEETQSDAVLFQGAAVEPAAGRTGATGQATSVHSGDGLQLFFEDQALKRVQAGDRAFAEGRFGGFLARDVAAESDFFAFANGASIELGLKVQAETLARPDHLVVQGRVSDLTGKDRAVTLIYAVPLPATGWHWGDDIRRSRAISGKGEFASQVSVRCGATGTQSLYPGGRRLG